MTKPDIQTLLDKYFEGETTLEEENRLKAYFQKQEVDPAFLPFQPLFQFFESEKQAALSEDFEQKLLEKIQARPAFRLRFLNSYLARAAAVAAVITGVVVMLPNHPTPDEAIAINWEQYEPQSDEEALAEATAALELLASKLNGGAKKASKELNKIERSSEVFK